MEPFEHFTADPSAAKPEEAPAYKSHLQPMRSFSSDLARAVREKGGSVVRSAIEENEKHEKEFELRNRASQQKYLLISIVIILMTSGVIFGLYTYKKETALPIVVETPVPASLITSDDFITIDTKGMQTSDLLNAITKASTDSRIREGTIRNIIITQTHNSTTLRLNANQFLSVIGAHQTPDLQKALSPEYMLGVSAYNGNNLFLVIHGTAHDFMLAGMLAWEPYMVDDLAGLFNNKYTASSYKNTPFTNTLVANRDARAVVDTNNKPVLFYSFIDPNTVLITTSPTAFSESIRRM